MTTVTVTFSFLKNCISIYFVLFNFYEYGTFVIINELINTALLLKKVHNLFRFFKNSYKIFFSGVLSIPN